MKTLGDVPIKDFSEKSLKHHNKQIREMRNELNQLRVLFSEVNVPSGGSTQLLPIKSYESPVVTDPAITVMDDQGRLALESKDQDGAWVHATPTLQTVPSSYFLDLRHVSTGVQARTITADWLVLHDNSSPWKTISLADVDVDLDISLSGPVAGGRDQAAAFASVWLNFFVIYSTSIQAVAALASLSATAPTLPSGYDYFVRVGSSYVTALGTIVSTNQMNEQVWHYKSYENLEPVTVNTREVLDISLGVPPTAKTVNGMFGNSSTVVGARGMLVSSESIGLTAVVNVLAPVTITGYSPGNSVTFRLPLLTSQSIYWTAGIKDNVYGIYILGYEDDL